jgi:hypothetical protein
VSLKGAEVREESKADLQGRMGREGGIGRAGGNILIMEGYFSMMVGWLKLFIFRHFDIFKDF